MSNLRMPDGFRYNIHGHDGPNGTEREPHVHVTCGSGELSISLNSCAVIAGSMDHNKERQAKDWVREHRYELQREWDQKSNVY